MGTSEERAGVWVRGWYSAEAQKVARVVHRKLVTKEGFRQLRSMASRLIYHISTSSRKCIG